ncbi:phage terminase small subunit [Virgibacillus subterraneus]|uniref:Phage terminase small subunit n=1 Tax=Virgibacillus subterraneus TaxID=621109 RepID=A0A1H8YYF6_9BACI|nr:terminase small subunit [Virgibacillus subterraneus]SEP57136.1 phage terminase small subunit [Virgibacillus subterraneus]
MNWDDIRKEWETSKITLKDLAAKHELKLGTLKSRKSREKWSRGATKKDATKSKKVATPNKKDATTKKQSEKESLPSDNLTDKQRLFCMYYLKTFNATQSAIKAGYSADTAHVQGSRLLSNVKVGEYIRELKASATDSLFLDATDILKKYAAIAFADITDYMVFGKKEIQVMGPFGPLFDDKKKPIMQEVNYVDFNESSTVDGTIITEAKQGKDGVSIKLADKMKALEMLTKYFDVLPQAAKDQLQSDKTKAEIEFIQERTKLIKGEKKDTGLLDTLIEGRKAYEQSKD